METLPKIEDIAAFCAVVDNGSISQAANILGETKGSISRRISRLESILEISLIQIKAGKAAPTLEGLQYKNIAEQSLELLSSAQAEIKNHHITPQGFLKVTTAQGIYRGTQLSKFVSEFLNLYPDIQLEMLMTEKPLSFSEHQIDFALRASFGQLKDSSHKAIYLQDLGMKFYVSQKYIKKYGVPKHPEELNNHKLLIPRIYGDGISIALQQSGKRKIHKLDLSGSLLSQDIVFLEEVCLAGGGIFIGSPGMNKNKKYTEILKDWHFPGEVKLYLLYPNRPLSPRARAFKDLIKDRFRK
jgi:DNA-binding transcriptional LysR family regulator